MSYAQPYIYSRSIPRANIMSSEEKYLCISKYYDGKIQYGEQIIDKDISYLALMVEDYYNDNDEDNTGIPKINFL